MSWEALIMQSKTLYFNKTLFRKNLMRFWPLWGGASLAGSLLPLAMIMEILHGSAGGISTPEMTAMFYTALGQFVPAVSLIYAILCALAVWHYLYNPRSVSLYHSLPIRREGLFITNFLSGMAMTLIPYVVVGALTALASLLGGFLDPLGLLILALGVIGDSFFYFASATLVAFITGNPFALAGLYFIFHFLAAALEALLSMIMAGFYFGVDMAYSGFAEWLSPTIFLSRNVYADTITHLEPFTASDGEIYQNLVVDRAVLVNGYLIALYALAGVVLAAAAWLLYKNRRSESAGDVIAVGWMKPVFRYGVSVCAALAGGLLFYSILFQDFYADMSGENYAALPMALCMVLGGLLGFYIASMLLAKSLHVFRSTWKGALAAAVVAAALCGAAAADPLGMVHWVPDAEELSSVSVIQNRLTGGVPSCSGYVEGPEAVGKVLDLHQAILAEHDAPRDQDGDECSQVNLAYTLKNGRVIHRRYTLTVPLSDAQTEGTALQKLAELVTDPELQRDNIFNRGAENGTLTGGYISSLYNLETEEYETYSLTVDEAEILEAAILRDIDAGRFGKSVYLPQDEWQDTAYNACIELYYTYDEEEWGHQTTYADASISKYCTETLNALKELGIVSETLVLETQKMSQIHTGGGMEDDFSSSYPYSSSKYYYDGTEIPAEEAF